MTWDLRPGTRDFMLGSQALAPTPTTKGRLLTDSPLAAAELEIWESATEIKRMTISKGDRVWKLPDEFLKQIHPTDRVSDLIQGFPYWCSLNLKKYGAIPGLGANYQKAFFELFDPVTQGLRPSTFIGVIEDDPLVVRLPKNEDAINSYQEGSFAVIGPADLIFAATVSGMDFLQWGLGVRTARLLLKHRAYSPGSMDMPELLRILNPLQSSQLLARLYSGELYSMAYAEQRALEWLRKESNANEALGKWAKGQSFQERMSLANLEVSTSYLSKLINSTPTLFDLHRYGFFMNAPHLLESFCDFLFTSLGLSGAKNVLARPLRRELLPAGDRKSARLAASKEDFLWELPNSFLLHWHPSNTIGEIVAGLCFWCSEQLKSRNSMTSLGINPESVFSLFLEKESNWLRPGVQIGFKEKGESIIRTVQREDIMQAYGKGRFVLIVPAEMHFAQSATAMDFMRWRLSPAEVRRLLRSKKSAIGPKAMEILFSSLAPQRAKEYLALYRAGVLSIAGNEEAKAIQWLRDPDNAARIFTDWYGSRGFTETDFDGAFQAAVWNFCKQASSIRNLFSLIQFPPFCHEPSLCISFSEFIYKRLGIIPTPFLSAGPDSKDPPRSDVGIEGSA